MAFEIINLLTYVLTYGRTKRLSQFRALHYMQSHGKNLLYWQGDAVMPILLTWDFILDAFVTAEALFHARAALRTGDLMSTRTKRYRNRFTCTHHAQLAVNCRWRIRWYRCRLWLGPVDTAGSQLTQMTRK